MFTSARSIFILIITLYVSTASTSITPDQHGLAPLFRLHHLDPPNHSVKRLAAEDQWFEQRLDHFNALNPTTWQQRYFSRYYSCRNYQLDLYIIIIILDYVSHIVTIIIIFNQ